MKRKENLRPGAEIDLMISNAAETLCEDNNFVSNCKIFVGDFHPTRLSRNTARSPFRVEVSYETGCERGSTVVYLGRVEFRFLKALMQGPATAAQLCERAGITDPRGHISRLRSKGIPIGDFWVESGLGTKCKRYVLGG